MEGNDNQQPDIIITEAELEEQKQQQQRTADFFANPQPGELAHVVIVEGLCAHFQRKFYILFEQNAPSAWKLVRFLDDSLDLSNQPSDGTRGFQKDLVGGKIDWSNLGKIVTQCPHCKSKSVVKCGNCSRLSCHPDGMQGSKFHCPWCDHRGQLSGHIRSLDGNYNKNKFKG